MTQVGGGRSEAPVRLSVLGALEVEVAGEARPVTRLQVRRLLTLLAAAGDATVSADQLIEHLWPSGLPALPRKALNVVLSRTRSLLAPYGQVLVTVPDGYRLDGCLIDLTEFLNGARSVADGTAGPEDVDRCREWLIEWRPPFADDPGAVALEPITADLEERRRQLTLRLAADDSAQDADGACRLLARLAADRPGDEGLAMELANRYAAAGRRDDALRVVSTTTRWLRTELGVDPSAEWSVIEGKLLGGGRDVGVTVPAPQVVAVPDILVGRDQQLADLEALPSGVVVVSGEPGVGKSAVIAELRRRLSRSGSRSVVGAAASTHPEAPLDPMAELCAELVAGGADISGVEAAMTRVCPHLVVARPSLIDRHEFERQVADFITRSADSVLIDDIQWLQDGPAAVLDAMIAADDDILVVLGFNTAHDLPEPVQSVVAGAVAVELEPLDESTVGAWIGARGIRGVTAETARIVHRQSGGNPLLATLLLDDWAEGRWRPGGDIAELTTDVRAVVQRRLDELPRAEVETLSVGALMGTEFRPRVLASIDANAPAAVAAGIRLGLLVESPANETVSFRHGLVAEVCAARVPSARKVGLHDRLHRALAAAGAAAVEYEMHAFAARSIDPLGAIQASLAAAGEHAGLFSWELALELVDRAVRIAEEHAADDELLAELLVRRGAIRRALVDVGYVSDLRRGIDAARAAGRDDLIATGVIELAAHGRTTTAGANDSALTALVEFALDLDVDDALGIELRSAAATFYSVTTEAGRSQQLYAAAIEGARRSGDRTLEERVLLNAQTGLSHPDDFPQLRAAALRLTELASSAESTWEAAFLRFGTAVVLGDPTDAEMSMRTMLDTVEHVKARPRLFGTSFSLAAYDLLRGDIAAAEARVGQVVDIGMRAYDPAWVMGIASMMLLSARSESGTLSSLRGAVDDLIADAPDYLPYLAVRSAMAIEDGDADLARADLDRLLGDQLGGVTREFHWTMVLALASRAAVEVGSSEQRSLLEHELSAHAGQMIWNGVCSAGPIDEVLGMLTEDEGARRLLAERAEALRQRFVDGFEPLDSSAFDELVDVAAAAHAANS